MSFTKNNSKVAPIMDTRLEEDALVLFLSMFGVFCGLYMQSRLRKKRKYKGRKYWVRPWIRRRDYHHSNTMLKLYKELLHVSISHIVINRL